MKPSFSSIIFIVFIQLSLLSCGNKTILSDSDNGIYYWRTILSLTDAERKFIDKHQISKMYVRFFDVDRDWEAKKDEVVVPNATIAFKDSIPKGLMIIPTIYITTDAMESMQLKEDKYAEKILKRINAICKQNDITYNELQLDCDWNKGTRDAFFNLCKAFKEIMDSTQILSSTIRLHQLIQTPPPVDKGVLMVYNTGNLMELTTENSIFSLKDIEPYLRNNRLKKYDLPLDVAYPVYGWSIVFHPFEDKYHFYRLMQRTDFSDYPGIKKIGKNLYEAIEDINFDANKNHPKDIYKDYRIRVERPTAHEIFKVKEIIEAQLKDKPHSNILYHLDESQLSHYNNNELDKIYHSN